MSLRNALRDRFVDIPGRHRPRHVRTGIIGLGVSGVIVAGGLAYSVSGEIPLVPKGGATVRAEFSSALNVNGDTPVRMAGVDVGRVTGVDSRDGGRAALVTMRVDDDVADELRRDASAASWSRLILGGTNYIELTAGSAGQDLGDETIPLARTQTQTSVFDVLNALTPDSRRGTRQIVKGIDRAFDDTASTRATLEAMDPALSQIGPAIGALEGERDGDLGRVVDGFDRIVKPLARSEQQLGALVDGAAATLAVTAARRAAIGKLLDDAPEDLAVTARELDGLEITLAKLDPVIDDLRPSAPKVGPALVALRPALLETRRLLDRAAPVVDQLRPTVTSLRGASRQGTPFLRDSRPSITRLESSILPSLHSTSDESGKRQFELIGPVVAAVDGLSSFFDQYGSLAGFGGGVSSRLLHDFLPCQNMQFNPEYASAPVICQDLLDFADGFLPGSATNPTVPPPSSARARKGESALKNLTRLTTRPRAGR